MDIRTRFLTQADGSFALAGALLAHGLMQGDPATFKAGYSRESATLAALEIFPETDDREIGQYLDGLLAA